MAEYVNGNGNGGIDTPTHPSPSSVGEIRWPPVAAHEQRAKGINSRYLTSSAGLLQAIGQFAGVEFSAEITRVTGRVFVDRNLLSEPEIRQAITPYLEGAVFLEGCGIEQLENGALLYLGKNQPDRIQSEEVLHQEINRANAIFAEPAMASPHSHDDYLFLNVNEKMRQDPDIQRQFSDLYKTFGWTDDEIIRMLENGNNMLMAAFHNGKLVSAGMAERAEIPLEIGDETVSFVMYEITEAATIPEHRRKGLYTKVAFELMRHLGHTDINLLYGESNSQAPGVLKAAKNLGRRSSLSALAELGFPLRLLEQHVTINDANGYPGKPFDKSKNDLLPTYMTRNELFEFMADYE